VTWIVEDWGTTLGTAGTLGWTKSTGGGWNAGAGYWEVRASGSRYGIFPSFATLKGCFGQTSQGGFRAGTGTLTGSQWHIGSASEQASGDYDYLLTQIAAYQGTEIYFGGGCVFNGAQNLFQFRTLKRIGTAGTFVQIAQVDIANAGAAPTNTIRFDITHDGGGSWSGTVTNLVTGSSGTYSYGFGTAYHPNTLDALTVGISAYTAGYYIFSNAFEYVPPPPVESILQFVGTWATGGSGTYSWGADVIGYPGDVQDRAYGPADSTGWASTVGITLDDKAGAWGSFAGTSTLPYEGTWILQRYWSGLGTGAATGSWVTLLTGFVDPDGVTYDYQRKTAKLTLQSTIARAAQSIALLDGTAVSVRGLDVPCRQRLLGTIAAVDPDTGTVRIGNVAFSPWEAETGCLLWGTSGISSQSIKIGSSITALGAVIPGGTGTVVLEGDIPPWMTVGAPAWITQAWPNYTARSGGYHPWTYVKSIIDGMPGLTWPADDMAIFTKQSGYSDISPNDRLYGGEKLTTALSGIMRAINGFYSVDPSGNFRARCLLPTVSVSGTVDFNAAYDSDWQMSYEPAYSRIEMDCSYNVAAGSFTEHVSVGGTQPWGEVRDVESRWVGSGIEAQAIAGRLYRNAYLPRPSLTLRLAGSRWADYLPGNLYAVHNLPASVSSLLTGTQMLLYSRTYSYADDLTAFELVNLPGGNYAVWDGTPADYWEGSGKVWF
jgi:hypothetical protein